MKHNPLPKTVVCSVLALALSGGAIYAQIPSQSTLPPGAGQTPAPQPGLRGVEIPPSPASDFLNSAIELNAAEVQLGQLATTKAESDRVKTFAQMLVKDHTAALQKLQKLQTDSTRGTPLLSAHHQELKTRLSGSSGAQFDKDYIDAMVTGHSDAVKMFEREIAASPSRPQSPVKPTDADVMSAATELLPTIKHHLDEARKVQKTLK